MHGGTGARRRNAIDSVRDASVSQNVGRGGTAAAVARRLAVGGVPACRRLATGGGLAGQWQTSLSLLAMPRRMGIVTARSLGDSNGLACLGWLATACRGQLRHNVRNNKIIKIIDKSVNVCL